MWYVVWTTTGLEERCRIFINRFCDPESFVRVAIPCRVESKKEKGIWTRKEKRLFPGYVFVESNDIEFFAAELQKVSGFQHILQSEKYYIPLSEPEEHFLVRLIGTGEVVEESKAIIVGSEVRVLEGPFVGQESLIKRIDRHKRFAIIEVEMFGRTTETKIGLEILEKIEKPS